MSSRDTWHWVLLYIGHVFAKCTTAVARHKSKGQLSLAKEISQKMNYA